MNFAVGELTWPGNSGQNVGEAVRSLLIMLASGLTLAVAGGVLAWLCYRRLRQEHAPLFLPFRPGCVPWNGRAVLVCFIAFVLVPSVVADILRQAGFFDNVPKLPAEAGNAAPAQKVAGTLRQLWVGVISFPLTLLAVWLPLRTAYGSSPPRSLFNRPEANWVVGYLGWCTLTPVVFAVSGASNWIWGSLTGRAPDVHPLTLVPASAGWLEQLLFVLEAVFLAPILEELVFRGALLTWLLQLPRDRVGRRAGASLSHGRPYFIAVIAIVFPLLVHSDEFYKAVIGRDWIAAFTYLAPSLFFVCLVPGLRRLHRWEKLGGLLRLRSASAWRSIWATAMLFASFHSGVWPTPVPLFVLALGLGYVAVRTRGILAPIFFHALFNAISVIGLLAGAQ